MPDDAAHAVLRRHPACRSTITRTFPSPRCCCRRACGAPVEAIYRFARERRRLRRRRRRDACRAATRRSTRYRRALDAIERGETPPEPPVRRRSRDAIRAHALPLAALPRPASAFAQDVTSDALRRRSPTCSTTAAARPIRSAACCCVSTSAADAAKPARDRDAICTALQLINFWQDVAIDWRKGRIYLPQEDLARFGVIAERRSPRRVRRPRGAT